MNWLAITTTVLGSLASLGFFFQTIKIVKNRDSKNISLITYLVLFITALFWLFYGISIKNIPLIVSYIIGTLSTASVIVVFLIYRKG